MKLFFPLNTLAFLILGPATYLKSSYKNYSVITNGRRKESSHYPLKSRRFFPRGFLLQVAFDLAHFLQPTGQK